MRVLVYAVRTCKNGEDAVQINNWPEEDTNAWLVNKEIEGVWNPIVPITIKRGVNNAFDQLLEATDLGSDPRSFAAHQYEQVNRVMAQLELFFVAHNTEDGLSV